MPNLFLNIPVPAANGAGASVDVSAMGANKTIVVGGPFEGSVTIEYATDDVGVDWAPVPNGTFVSNPGRVTIPLAARWLRAVMSAYKSGAANADVGASNAGDALFAQLSAVASDISHMPPFKTVVADGAGNVEFSEDGVSWSTVFSFQAKGGQSGEIFGQFARFTGGGSAWMGAADLVGDSNEITPAFPNPPIVQTIYARTTGDDVTGTGTLANPYLTFQRAIRDVPLVVPSGYRYIVDVTDLGTETFPPGYAMPPIHGAGQLDQSVPVGTDPWFRFRGAVSIYATPKVLSTIPVADTAIAPADIASIVVQNADDGLYLLTLVAPRAAWNANGVKGAIFRASNFPSGDAVVVESTTTTLLLATTVLPVAPMTLMEPSATFQGTVGTVGGASSFNVFNVDSFVFGGIRFVNTAGVAQPCLNIRSAAPAYAFQYCDFGRIVLQGGAAYNPVFDTCWIHGGTSIQAHGIQTSFRKTLIDGCTSFDTIPDAGYVYLTSSVWQNGVPLGDVKPFNAFQAPVSNQCGGGLGVWLSFCRVRFGTSVGIKALAGGTVERTTVEGCVGNAIEVDRARAMLRLTRVSGATNGGIGLKVTQNSFVNVDSLTVVSGAGGDLQVANNAVRTWVNFRGVAPLLEENDLAAGVLSQICRVFQT